MPEDQSERQNGRLATQLRSLRCEKGVLSRADGSVRWIQDGTAVLVGIYGPRQTYGHLENPQAAAVQVNFKPANGSAGARERLLEATLRKAAEHIILASMHPRTLVSITLQELSDGGGLLACSLNAISIALSDAGVPMRCILVAATCCVDSKQNILIDPDREEEQECQGLFTGCYTARLHRPDDKQAAVSQGVVAAKAAGDLSVAEFLQLRDLTRKCCQRIAAFSRQSIMQTFQ